MRCFQHRTTPLTNAALTQPHLRLPAQAALPPLRTVVLADPALEVDVATHTRAPMDDEDPGDSDPGDGDPGDGGGRDEAAVERGLAMQRDETHGEAVDPLEEAVRLLRPLPLAEHTQEPQAEAPSSPAPRTIPIPPRIGPIDGPARRTRPVEAVADDGAEPMWLDPGATSAPRSVPPIGRPHEDEAQREAVSALIDPPAPSEAESGPDHQVIDPPAPSEAEPRPDHLAGTPPEQLSRPVPAAADHSSGPPAETSPSGLLSRIAELTDPPSSPQRDNTVAIPRTPPPATSASPRPLFRDEFVRAVGEPEPVATPPLEVPEFLVPGFDESVVPADPATGMPLGTVLSGVLGPELWRRCHVEWSGAHCIALARVARAVDGLAPAAVTSLWSGATAGLRWLGATREQDELAEAVADAIAHPDGASKTNSARTIRLYGAAICAAVGRPMRRCACHRDLARDVSEELIELGLAGLADPLPAAGGPPTRPPNLARPPRA